MARQFAGAISESNGKGSIDKTGQIGSLWRRDLLLYGCRSGVAWIQLLAVKRACSEASLTRIVFTFANSGEKAQGFWTK
jgi:hypothetical protein